ncbi:MAG: GFA family protein [Alphaproteobacteria bacterium]|nr:GFA family protein [Alphaproteobacteria bacterium]
MKVDGGCHCGAITYEAMVDPESCGVCHCTDCQKFSGGAFRIGVVAQEENFEFLSGSPKTYVKTGDSGAPRAQVFCSDCGTHIFSTSVGEGPKEFRIRTPTTNQCSQLTPKSQGWFRSAQSWVTAISAIPSREKQ